jgi:RHS repeat-associated protein
MRLKSILAKDPGQNPLVTRQYTYSPVGNITNKDTEHGNYVYQYDDLYRLTAATNPTSDDEAYTYDALDNRLTSAATTGIWSYNANNELQSYGNVTFEYDLNGNTTNKTNGTSQTNYVYDVEDRLTRVEDGQGSVIAEYYYDPFGRRLWKEVDGVKTYFLYSDEGLIAEYDSTGTELRTYGYAPDSQWTTDPLFQKVGSDYYWYQNDHLGTPQKLIASNGLVVWAGTYDSFGNCQIEMEGIENNFRFPGQYYDQETNLHYNLNRYYDPKLGRYLRTDPFGQGLNLYAYVFNNPVSWIDPLGLCAAKEVWNWWSDFWTSDPDFLIPEMWIRTGDYWKNIGKETWDWWSDLVVADEVIPEPGESWKSYNERFTEAHEAQMAISDALGLWGLRSLIATSSMYAVIKGGEAISQHAAKKSLTTAGGKGFLYIKGLRRTMRLRQLSCGFALAGKLSGLVTVGATAYSAGLRIKPWIIWKVVTDVYNERR